MLRSPGYSPRHVSSSSPSPSPFSGNSLQTPGASSSITQSNPSRKRPRVLDEDSYVAAIEKIVERDFFPDISKLRDRLDWLEAIKTGDPIQIRDAQLKIIERRGKRGLSGEADCRESEDEVDTNLSLDEFFRRGRKRDRITDGYGTSDQPPSTLEGWKYTAKNLLMYHPADRGEAPLTEEELAIRLKGVISPVAGATPMPMSGRDQDKGKKYDLEDLRKTPNQFYVESRKKAENGYSFVRTPSPAPGVDESPFITWGEIEGTPLRLEPEDTPIDIGGSGDGPHFKIPCPPARDVKAHSLSREAAWKLKERSKMFKKPATVAITL
ncbi:putative WRKY transcription factor [Hibiscus syriacus]|uniref:WRKY transcription factor n=1 Tax=Hibiscus syriacus TaxID=106335 RepID=A0A6A3CU00_HIBSY|nr:putative WRKY transcription factor [Hibiscus syriacus]